MFIAQTFLIALTGGAIFYLLHVPLPWTLGPMTTVMIWRLVLKRQAKWPLSFRNTALLLLGYVMGAPFTAETAHRIYDQLPTMVLVTTGLIAASILSAVWASRYSGISLASSVMGNIPGGLSQMVVLAEEIKDADCSIVTFMQTARLISVIFIVPFLAMHSLAGDVSALTSAINRVTTKPPAYDIQVLLLFCSAVGLGAGVARRLHFPTPYMLGPLIGTALLVYNGFPPPPVPPVMLAVSQIFVGANIGMSIQIDQVGNWKRVFISTIFGVAAILMSAFIVSFILTRYQGLSQVSAFLSSAPGGITEMGLTAIALGADLSSVVAYQLFRLFFILLIVPPFLKWWLGKSVERKRSCRLPDEDYE